MNKNKLESRLIEAINNSFDDQCESLDVSTINRLKQMRANSLASEQKISWLARVRQQLPMHALSGKPVVQASIAMLVAVFSISFMLTAGGPVEPGGMAQTGSLQENSVRPLSEMDVLMSNEDMEFLENLEIYEWLVAEYG